MDWDMRNNIAEVRIYIYGMKEMCRILETPKVDFSKSVFLIFMVLCEKILSLLPETDEVEEKQEGG